MFPIQKTIHHIWLGPKPISGSSLYFIKTWRDHHPDWEFKLWREEDVFPLQNQSLFEEVKDNYGLSTDILRYEIIYKYGGLYIDTDYECFKNFDPLLQNASALLATAKIQEHPGWWTLNGFLYAIPEHPFYKFLLDELPQWYEEHKHLQPYESTGPTFIGWTLQKWRSMQLRKADEDVVIVEPKYLCPFSWWEDEDIKRGPFPEAYALHHWHGSWFK